MMKPMFPKSARDSSTLLGENSKALILRVAPKNAGSQNDDLADPDDERDEELRRRLCFACCNAWFQYKKGKLPDGENTKAIQQLILEWNKCYEACVENPTHCMVFPPLE